MFELILSPQALPPPAVRSAAATLIHFWMQRIPSENTRRSYGYALADFARFTKQPSQELAVEKLLQAGRPGATFVVEAWKADLLQRRGLCPATVNSRLAAVRSILVAAADLDLIAWSIHVKDCKTATYLDTRGPGLSNFVKMFQRAERTFPRDLRTRNVAILRLLFDLGLRASEAVGLDVAHVDLANRRVWVLGKGRLQREPMTLPAETADAIQAWLGWRGDRAGPLFTLLSNHGRGRRITRQTIFRLVRELGTEAAGIRTSPHKVRHTAITTLAAAGLPLLTLQRFARHSDPKTTTRYIDNLTDAQGEAATQLAQHLTTDGITARKLDIDQRAVNLNAEIRRKIREAGGIRHVAAKSGVNFTSVKEFTAGRRGLSAVNLERLMRFFGKV